MSSERERAAARNAGLLDTVTYKRDSKSGEMVQAVSLSDGRTAYVEAEPGREFVEVTDAENRGVGTFIPIADVNVAIAQAEKDSHEQHFEERRTDRGRSAVGFVTGQAESGVAQLWETRYGDLVNEENVGQRLHHQYTEMDPAEVKQRMRQLDAYQSKFTEAMSVRIAPPVGHFPIQRVSDEQFLDLTRQYKDALRRGEERHCEFQPLSTYVHKIIRTNPHTGAVKILRNIIDGEVGIYGLPGEWGTILILKEGYGSGKVVGVPVEVVHVGQATASEIDSRVLPSKEAIYAEARQAFVDGAIRLGKQGQRTPAGNGEASTGGGIKLQDPDFDEVFPDDGSGPTSFERSPTEPEGE
jgi:hypothetical protein